MKRTSKNKKGTLPDFIRYIRGEMTKREENNFQRYLQKDPFAEEAIEGFSQVSPDELENDLEILGKKINTRTAGKQKYIYYRIAASVAVLMIISSVYVISTKNKTERELSKTAVSETPLEIPASVGIEERSENKFKDSDVATAGRDIEESSAEPTAGKSGEQTDEMAVTGGMADQTDNETDENVMEMTEIQEEAFNRPITQKKATVTPVRGKIIPEQAKMQAAPEDPAAKGKSSGTASDTGYILEMTVSDSTGQTSYLPPVPLDGKENYDKYIEENIRIPDSIPEGQNIVVELDLLVKSTGIIDTIKVTGSPGDEFSEEAIRLVKEGPPWKPAEREGNPIDDQVSVRIEFK